jgi:flavin reductase (DIM6/NTAB) family NADH-FMN oxidoreductase RutF
MTMSNNGADAILGRIPSGIYILTVGSGERATGMLASWVMQAGFDPPMVTAAVKQGRYVCDWISEGQPFALNVLGESQMAAMAHFGRGFEPGAPAFEDIEITHCPRGVPILKEALGHLECELVGQIDSSDHRVFLAKIVRGNLADDGRPMVHLRKSGSHY